MTLAETAKEFVYLGYNGYKHKWNSDNQNEITLAKNPVSHARAKHINIPHHFIRETIQDQIIWGQYLPTSATTADSLTKAPGRE